jgi:hypothetical protein
MKVDGLDDTSNKIIEIRENILTLRRQGLIDNEEFNMLQE